MLNPDARGQDYLPEDAKQQWYLVRFMRKHNAVWQRSRSVMFVKVSYLALLVQRCFILNRKSKTSCCTFWSESYTCDPSLSLDLLSCNCLRCDRMVSFNSHPQIHLLIYIQTRKVWQGEVSCYVCLFKSPKQTGAAASNATTNTHLLVQK